MQFSAQKTDGLHLFSISVCSHLKYNTHTHITAAEFLPSLQTFQLFPNIFFICIHPNVGFTMFYNELKMYKVINEIHT